MYSTMFHLCSVKGQSAIEYLMTYGWMLLVVAVVGGAVFSIVQGQAIESSSGFTGGDIAVENFGLSQDNSLDMVLRNTAAETVEVGRITLSQEGQDDEEISTFVGEELKVGDPRSVSALGAVEQSGANTIDVEVNYDVGGLTDQVVRGTVSGNLVAGREEAEPGNGEWEFVDISEVNQSTVDTSTMSDFYIMKYEASRKGNATSGLGYEPVSRENHVPWAGVSQNDAIDRCQAAGFSLPNNKQWQAATMAEIGNSSTQPLGNTNHSEDANGNQGTIDPTGDTDWDNDGENDRVLTGSGPESWSNTIGIFDLSGNVWELTSTDIDAGESNPTFFNGTNGYITGWNPDYAGPSDETNHLGSSNSDYGGDYYWSKNNSDVGRVVRRGGTWGDDDVAGVFSLGWRNPPYSDYIAFGFRCIKTS